MAAVRDDSFTACSLISALIRLSQMNIREEPERRLLGTEVYSRPIAASTGRLSTMPWAGVRSPQASDMACMTAALMP